MKNSPVAALLLGVSLIVSTVILSNAIERFGSMLVSAAQVFNGNDGTPRKFEVTVGGGREALGVQMK